MFLQHDKRVFFAYSGNKNPDQHTYQHSLVRLFGVHLKICCILQNILTKGECSDHIVWLHKTLKNSAVLVMIFGVLTSLVAVLV